MSSTETTTSHNRPVFILLPRTPLKGVLGIDPTEGFFERLFCLARFHQDVQSALDGVPTPAALGAEK
jgi:hypothetical protein